jgi:Protein of unknown function (DUF3341)
MTSVHAEFADPEAAARAIEQVRAQVHAGDHVWLEAYTPYPSREIEHALRARRSRLAAAVFAAGIGAAAAAYALQWLLNAYLYPLDVGGRPPHFPLAFVPITFEMGVLFAALTAFAGVLVGGRLVRLWHPSRDVHGIESATHTSFWLEIETDAPAAEVERLIRLVRDAGAIAIVRAGGAA